jgi:hypothetical protein
MLSRVEAANVLQAMGVVALVKLGKLETAMREVQGIDFNVLASADEKLVKEFGFGPDEELTEVR